MYRSEGRSCLPSSRQGSLTRYPYGAGWRQLKLTPAHNITPKDTAIRAGFWLVAEHGGAECGGGVGLHAGEDVLVDGHGEGGAGVAEAFADDLHGDVGF